MNGYERSTTPLNLAVRNEHLVLSKLLFENGADVNTLDKKACTPLHIAARYGHINAIAIVS